MQQVNTVRYHYSINYLMSHLLEYQHQYKDNLSTSGIY